MQVENGSVSIGQFGNHLQNRVEVDATDAACELLIVVVGRVGHVLEWSAIVDEPLPFPQEVDGVVDRDACYPCFERPFTFPLERLNSGKDRNEGVVEDIAGVVIVGYVSIDYSHQMLRILVKELLLGICDAPLATLANIFLAHHMA